MAVAPTAGWEPQFAMVFLASKAFFCWLAAAGLPVLIWWLYRRRQSIVEWSANFVLRLTLRHEGKRRLWRQFVILTLRTLALALLVLGVASPWLKRARAAGELPHGEGSLHQVVLVDNSRSMSIAYQSFTREAERNNRLESLLLRTRYGDHCEVIPLAVPKGEKLKALTVPCPTTPAAIRQLLEEMPLRERPAALLDGLQLAAERFSVTSAQTRHLVILNDLTLKDLPPPDGLQTLRPELAKLGVRTVAYEIRDREKPNLAISDVTAGAATMFAGWRYHFYLTIHNYSRQPVSTSLNVEVQQEGKVLESVALPLDLKATERKLFDFPLTLPNVAGLLTLVATVNDEAYQFDNRREFSVLVKPALRLTLVRDSREDQTKLPLWRDSYYFETALAALTRPTESSTGPKRSGWAFVRDPATGRIVQIDPRTGSGWDPVSGKSFKKDPKGGGADALAKSELKVEIKRLKAEELTPALIADSDVVACFGVSSVDPVVREALRAFVEQGGGLLLGLAEPVVPEQFNESFAALTPAPVLRPALGAQRDRLDWDYDAPHQQIEKTFEHPLLRPYLSESEGSIENVRVYNYFKVGPGGSPLMVLGNGDPLLLEQTIGRGKVLLLTSTLGGLWNTFPVRNMYVNFVYAWLTYLSSFRSLEHNVQAGDPWIMPVSPQAPPDVRITLPLAGKTFGPLVVRTVRGQAFYRFDETTTPGTYTMFTPETELAKLTVQEQLLESDTIGLEAEARTMLGRNLGGLVSAAWPEVATGLGEDQLLGRDLAGLFFLAVVGCLFADAVLTRLWFR